MCVHARVHEKQTYRYTYTHIPLTKKMSKGFPELVLLRMKFEGYVGSRLGKDEKHKCSG